MFRLQVFKRGLSKIYLEQEQQVRFFTRKELGRASAHDHVACCRVWAYVGSSIPLTCVWRAHVKVFVCVCVRGEDA